MQLKYINGRNAQNMVEYYKKDIIDILPTINGLESLCSPIDLARGLGLKHLQTNPEM